MESYPNARTASWKTEEIQCGQQLVKAAGDGDIEEVKRLLSSGAPIDAGEYNKSLFYAFKNYITPLQAACEKNHYGIVKLLIDTGADINATDRFDVTAVHTSADKGHFFCLKELLDAGADCSVPTKPVNKGCDTTVTYVGGTTPLHLAAAGNQVECIIELIQAGADYNATDEKGRTSLYIAAQCGFEDCVLAHLKYAIGKDILSLPSYGSHDTPLHFAVKNGMVRAVEKLLILGSDPNHQNISGYSPLHYAVIKSSKLENCAEVMLKLLVLHGRNVDVNKLDGSRFTPLHYVCFNGTASFARRPALACFLLAYGANPLIKNQRGYSIIESEMRIHDADQSILKAVVQSLLHLPPMNTLKLNAAPLSRHPPTITPFDVYAYPMQRMFSVSEYLESQYEDWGIEREFYRNFNLNFATNFRSPATQPPVQNVVPDPKYEWYGLMAAQPRSLKHYCRYRIREALGYRRLHHVDRLHLPRRLQGYLLLENNGSLQ